MIVQGTQEQLKTVYKITLATATGQAFYAVVLRCGAGSVSYACRPTQRCSGAEVRLAWGWATPLG